MASKKTTKKTPQNIYSNGTKVRTNESITLSDRLRKQMSDTASSCSC